MPPSDSDDETPEGGYYIVDRTAKKEPVSPPTSPISPPMTSLQANLLPQRPTKPATGWPAQPPPNPVYETIEPSDSDEEPPVGGYEVRTTNAKERATLLSRPVPRKVVNRTSEVGSSISRRKTAPSRRMGDRTRTRRHTKEAP